MDDVKVASNLETTTYTHPTAVAQGIDVEWCVTQACTTGGESVSVCVTDKCGELPLPPCEPVTAVKAAYDLDDMEIIVNWTAPALATIGYEVFKDGVSKGVVNVTEYFEDISELEPGDYEFEYCVLPKYDAGVCEGTVAEDCDETSFTIVSIKKYTSNFTIMPNPASNNIMITSGSSFNTVEVLSFLGQVVITQPNMGTSAKLDISNLTNGVYFVRIVSDSGTSVKKFVKQ
jgi:hypothetical protein